MRQLQIINPGENGYTLQCENCGKECATIAIVDGFFIGKCCSPDMRPQTEPATSVIARLRLIKKAQ